MKTILIFAALLLASCTTTKYVVVDSELTIYKGKVTVKELGKPLPIGDTTIRGMFIKPLKH